MHRIHPALLLVVLAAGCAHYGFAGDARGGGDQPAVAVWTVATPAHEGLDRARLTRTLVDRLNERGVRARWQPEASRESVRCTVRHTEVSGFDDALFATAEVACDVGPDGEPARRFSASGSSSTTGRIDDPVALSEVHATVQEAAALDALERLGAQITHWRLGPDFDPPETET